MVQFHDVITIQDESVCVIRADKIWIQFLHTPSWKIQHSTFKQTCKWTLNNMHFATAAEDDL